MNIEDFVGEKFTKISGMESGSENVCFETESETYLMHHKQDCCESVELNDVRGDPADLIGTPILTAYEEDSGDAKAVYETDESFTWTFYRLATIKGTVTLRWYGTSNGYYSEGVNIVRLEL